tara:strand:- start:73 stop:744 length:672 start_codon:yes stop_codon:yes gene_type:complete
MRGNLWSKFFLKHLPDKTKSAREDHIRVREADNPLSNISRQFPLWIAAFVNSILFLEPVEVMRILGLKQVDTYLHEPIDFCIGIPLIFLLSLIFSALIGGIIRNNVHAELTKIIERSDFHRIHTGFDLYNSYDDFVPSKYIQQQWPRSRKGVSALEIEHEDYWINQKSAWKGLFVKSNLAGMFFTIGMGFCYTFFPIIAMIVIVITGALLLYFMPEKKRWHRI